jgi:GTP-binding protein
MANAFCISFTKADKNKPGATTRNVETFLSAMAQNWEQAPPYFVTSAHNKTGREPLLDYIGHLNSSFTKL